MFDREQAEQTETMGEALVMGAQCHRFRYGDQYRNLKTAEVYKVLGVGIDATNGRGMPVVVIYSFGSAIFTRDREEFKKKFEFIGGSNAAVPAAVHRSKSGPEESKEEGTSGLSKVTEPRREKGEQS